MAAKKQSRENASEPKRGRAGKRTRRSGVRRSLNLSVCADHHTRFKGLSLLMDREPSELLMDWIEENSKGMRFSLPGLSVGSDGEEPAAGAGEGTAGHLDTSEPAARR